MNPPSSSDDGPTVIRTAPTGPPCDFAPSSTLWSDSLPEGLRLGEYEIRSVIGEGGFGIVYLAYDHFLQRQVALKEYMPSTLAGRARTGLEVMVKAERHRETFLAGLRSFVNEARLLAQFDHPALVKVYRFWEANGTAYMVMPYCVGPTLKEALVSHDGPPEEEWLRHQLLAPLLEALSLLHKAQCLHRDIAPDNILLTETGPLLLDFGAARQIIGDMSHTLTVVLKPGYAPIEQYGEVASMRQGAWTDLYAMAGVVRYALTGKVPVAATSRILQDTLTPLAEMLPGQYSDSFLHAVDTALAVRPADRPQNVAQFQALLEGLDIHALEVVDVEAAATGPGGLAPAATMPGALGGAITSRSWHPSTSPGSTLGSGKTLPQANPTLPGAGATTGRTRPPATQSVPAHSPPPAASHSPVAAAPSAGVQAEAVAAASAVGPSRSPVPVLAAVMVTLAVAAAAAAWWFLKGGPQADEAAHQPAPVKAAVPPETPRAAEPAPALPPPAQPEPAAVQPVVPETKTPEPMAPEPAVATPAVQPPAVPTPPPPVLASPPPAPQPAPPPAARPVAAAPAVAPPKRVSSTADKAGRCSDILQKASLEPLSASEAAFLTTECK